MTAFLDFPGLSGWLEGLVDAGILLGISFELPAVFNDELELPDWSPDRRMGLLLLNSLMQELGDNLRPLWTSGIPSIRVTGVDLDEQTDTIYLDLSVRL